MNEYETVEGGLTLSDARVAMVVSRFNSFISERLLDGALDTLQRHGLPASNITVVRAPGAFEIPLVAKTLAARKEYAGIVALGAVIRGATPHFEYVAGECVKGLAQVGMQFDIPIGFGVLTVDTVEQAVERAGTKAGNKGAEAALSVIEMIDLMQRLRG